MHDRRMRSRISAVATALLVFATPAPAGAEPEAAGVRVVRVATAT